ncbi:MAG: peptidase M64 [Acidobacteria bacterium]|nr:peptidase M64 [Acidobacteriota bacterium]
MNAFRAAFAVLPFLAVSALAQPTGFDARFTSRTMRVDLAHTGGTASETISLSKVVDDGPWAGSRTRLLDDSNLGKYFFEVRDLATNAPLYSRGYASLYGEWESTGEARTRTMTLSESLRFPWPKAPVQITLRKRDAKNLFREIFTTSVDPSSPDVNRAPLGPRGKVVTLLESGPASAKVDLLVIGEGYTAKEMPKLRKDADRLLAALFAEEPFKSRRSDFNVRLLELPCDESGVHRPQSGIHRRTPLSVQYNIFGSERYVLTYDDVALRDAASAAPYEFLEILVNDAQYGGGGIYGYQATCSADTAFADYVFVHEFGHHFAGLADEYYTSDVAYETGAAELPEPWEPNVTAHADAKSLKWKDLVKTGTAIPTPWEKEAYEKEARAYQAERRKRLAAGAPPSEIDALFTKQREWEEKFLASMPNAGKVGAFEGAAYEAKGLYRSSADCIMFTRDRVGFCPVCRRAIERVIDLYSR